MPSSRHPRSFSRDTITSLDETSFCREALRPFSKGRHGAQTHKAHTQIYRAQSKFLFHSAGHYDRSREMEGFKIKRVNWRDSRLIPRLRCDVAIRGRNSRSQSPIRGHFAAFLLTPGRNFKVQHK